MGRALARSRSARIRADHTVTTTEAATEVGWRRVCALAEIPRLGARVVQAAVGDVAIFRNEADELFALLDRCPHKGGPLSQGIVMSKHVACPLHNWSIGLENGRAAAPDEGCTRVFPVKMEAGGVFLLI